MGGGQEDQVDESIFCSNTCNLIVYDSDNKENEDSDEETIVGNFTWRGFGWHTAQNSDDDENDVVTLMMTWEC